MKYHNPIIPGYHPDPSICRVGEDYYLVTSSFEYFPGVPIFHSRDLINWEQIGHCISRREQLKLMEGDPNRTGIFAPTLRYHQGIFYMITTNVAYEGAQKEPSGNFFVTATDPAGEWSDPIWIPACGGIDPSLYFAEDGRAYYCGSDGGIYLCELNLQDGSLNSEKKYIWNGTGGCCPEGPHIYRIGDWYYLLISEGGTEYAHMITIARSRQIEGPYEACPNNPVLSNRSHNLSINATGHADLVEDQNGNWWAVCLGIRPIPYPFHHNLGRETMLVPVYWDEAGWPVMGNQGLVEEEIETLKLPVETKQHSVARQKDYFDKEQLDFGWNFIYEQLPDSYLWNQGQGMTLYGNATSLSEASAMTWLGRRQEQHHCKADTELHFIPVEDGEEAGMTVLLNNRHHYEIALTMLEGQRCLIFRRQIGSLWKIENQILCQADDLFLEMEADEKNYTFRYSLDGKAYETIGQGEVTYLTTEVGGAFTGCYIALYATGNGKKCVNGANFKWFSH